jgi:hypothetical protein
MLAIILAIGLFAISTDTVQVKGTSNIYYRIFTNDSSLCLQCKTNKNWAVPITIDKGNISEYAMTATSGDYIHIVWQREEQGGDVCRIYYVTTLDAITPDDIRHGREPVWSEITPISTQDPLTEPASNPFVEAYGDVVYAVWRGPYDEGNQIGEIWQRGRRLSDPYYEWRIGPWDVSESPEQESDYPVQATSDFIAWQEYEHDNWEIKLRYKDDPIRNISQTETDSKYPHINVKYNGLEAPVIYFIWTETVEPDRLYEVRFLPYNYASGRDNSDKLIYYSVNPGDSIPSFYCEHRDGYIPYPNFPIDFGNNQLSYHLDYLNPAYYYKAKAIAYHNATGRFKQRFSFDNIPSDSIEFQPGRPETIEVYIPKNTYRQDLKSILSVARSRGNFSALADFNLYQFEVIDSTNSSGPQSAGSVSIPLVSIQNFPNPFRTNMKIRFSLSSPLPVRLKVFNSSGRLVRTLLNETKEAGVYQIYWDGTDNNKKLLSSGIYFVNLEADNYKETHKTLLLR